MKKLLQCRYFIKVIRIIAYILLIAGGIGFFFPLLIALGPYKWISGDVELPLATVDSFAVDSKGRIYCALLSRFRIQQYSTDGKFLRGWWVDDTGGGAFDLYVNKDDLLLVQTARTDLRYVFDSNGRQLSKVKSDAPGFDSVSDTDSSGNRYTVTNPELFPRIVKITPSGGRVVLRSVPLYLWPVSGPLSGWLTMAAGAFILWYTGRLRKEQLAG